MTRMKRPMVHAALACGIQAKTILLLALASLGVSHTHAQKREYIFGYDPAGNIISRESSSVPYHAQNRSCQSFKGIASVKGDEGWCKVKVSICMDIAAGDMLLIYSSSGLLEASIPISCREFTLNLSHLHRGSYVFCFHIGRQTGEFQINKRK